MIKVSVILPVYNGGKFIAETIESMLSQTIKDFEVLVVDDGSTDDSKEIIQKYISNSNREIRYFYQENKGIAAARNKGIKESNGKYIAFLDQDDLWLPEKLERQVKYLEENPDTALVYTDSIRFGDCSNAWKLTPYEGKVFLQLINGNFISALTVVVRREVFKKVGCFDEDRNLMGCDDYDMWLRIASIYKIGYINEKLARWRAHSKGYTYAQSTKMNRAAIAVLEKNFRLFKFHKIRITDFRRKILSPIYFGLGWIYFNNRDFKTARQVFTTAIKYNPLSFKYIAYYILSLFPVKIVNFLTGLKRQSIERKH